LSHLCPTFYPCEEFLCPVKGFSFLPGSGLVPPLSHHFPGPGNKKAGRCSPPAYFPLKMKKVQGNPDPDQVFMAYVERQNLTMRVETRRFIRLTNAFSKKAENLEYAVALHFMHYNFCRIHQTLKVTPAMKVKVTDHVWGIEEVLNLLKR
jgi:hypothetical protein